MPKPTHSLILESDLIEVVDAYLALSGMGFTELTKRALRAYIEANQTEQPDTLTAKQELALAQRQLHEAIKAKTARLQEKVDNGLEKVVSMCEGELSERNAASLGNFLLALDKHLAELNREDIGFRKVLAAKGEDAIAITDNDLQQAERVGYERGIEKAIQAIYQAGLDPQTIQSLTEAIVSQ